MREILFRAWHPSQKEMVYFDGNKLQDHHIASHFGLLVNNEHPEGKDLLMQFTGLTDKNGVKIFEGDVCEYYSSSGEIIKIGKVMHSLDHSKSLRRDQDKYLSCDDDGGFLSCFGVVCKDNLFMSICWYCRPYEYMKVIGNIHQNKGILK